MAGRVAAKAERQQDVARKLSDRAEHLERIAEQISALDECVFGYCLQDLRGSSDFQNPPTELVAYVEAGRRHLWFDSEVATDIGRVRRKSRFVRHAGEIEVLDRLYQRLSGDS